MTAITGQRPGCMSAHPATDTAHARFDSAIRQAASHGTLIRLNTGVSGVFAYADEHVLVDTDSGPTPAHLWTINQDGTYIWNSKDQLCTSEEISIDELCYCIDTEYDEDEEGNERVTFEAEVCGYCTGRRTPQPDINRVGAVLFYFDADTALHHAQVAAAAFRDHGFTVTWDGTPDDAVEVEA